MLRRKLLIRIGLLVACFVMGAAVAIYLLQNTIPDIDHINRDAATLIDGIHEVADAAARIEDARDGLVPQTLASEESAEATLTRAITAVGVHPALKIEGSPQAKFYQNLRAALPRFMDPSALSPTEEKLNRAEMRSAIGALAKALRAYVADEQVRFARYQRLLVLGLTLAALVMVNVAVLVLLRTAQVVLRPVGQLVEGSRELAAEHFEHRVTVEQQDEFGELARAYNRLAEQLQANEERKAETLRQLAVTLNHDLNNALATAEMQLSLLDRQSGSDLKHAKYVRDIQATLRRMGERIASLKHIRRVVLMDYVDGQKMVDLEQSVVAPPRASGEVA